MKTKIITLKLDQPIQVGDVIKSKLDKDYYLIVEEIDRIMLENWQSQTLLIISDDEIKEGDIYYDSILKSTISWTTHYANATYNKSHCKKIIASYPPLDSLPTINHNDLYYICELLNKGIDEIELEEEVYYTSCKLPSEQYKSYRLKLIDNCVVIKRQEEKTQERSCETCGYLPPCDNHKEDLECWQPKQPTPQQRLFIEEDMIGFAEWTQNNQFSMYNNKWTSTKIHFMGTDYATKQLLQEYIDKKKH